MPQDIIITIDTAKFIGLILTMTASLILIVWKGGQRIGAIETSINWIKEEMGKFWGRLEKVEGAGSPINPTQKGTNILKDSGLSEIIDNTEKEWILEEFQKFLPKNYTEYDVQLLARTFMVSLKNESIMKPVKKYSFDNGRDLEIILRLGGLWLRDNFLKIPHKISGPSS